MYNKIFLIWLYFVFSTLWNSLPRPRGGCVQQFPALGVSRLHHCLRLLAIPAHLREAVHPPGGPGLGDGGLRPYRDLGDEEEEVRHYEEGWWCCGHFPKVYFEDQWRIWERRLIVYILLLTERDTYKFKNIITKNTLN